MQARGLIRMRAGPQAEFVANAETEEEEQDGAEDGLKGEKARSQASGVSICQIEILAEAEHV